MNSWEIDYQEDGLELRRDNMENVGSVATVDRPCNNGKHEGRYAAEIVCGSDGGRSWSD